MTTVSIPFNRPFVTGKEKDYVTSAIQGQTHAGNGEYGRRCIELLQQRYRFLRVFLTPSCTAALEMAAILSDIQAGEEVIMPSYTFPSTANAFVLRGATPVFAEVYSDTLNLDVDHAAALINARTKAIAPIDYAGVGCDIDSVNALARKRGLRVVQDAAQSLHSYHSDGEACGAAADLAAISFHETKNFSCGEGGALVVNDKALVDRAEIVQEKGTDRSLVLRGVRNKYGWTDLGSSFLLSDILAAMLLAQLESAERIVALRGTVINEYRKLFSPYLAQKCLSVPVIPGKARHNNHAFFVIFDTEANRNLFLDRLRERNVHAYIGYMPLHASKFGARLGYQEDSLPRTASLAKRVARLPVYPSLALTGLPYCLDVMQDVLRTLYD